jgi:son of sevenless-like protein
MMLISGKSQENVYRMTFLMTYKSFTDASTVFAMLTDRYVMQQPPGLTEAQLEEWKDKKLRPAQSRVLVTLTEWVDRYRLVKDELHLVPLLKEFLPLVTDPPNNANAAKRILQSIEKHEAFASSSSSHSSSSSVPSPPLPVPTKRLKIPPLGVSSSKGSRSKNELLKIDSLEFAQHLTLVEYRLYAKIRPAECMTWPKVQKGPEVENLARFCATSDKLVAWVKYSVLKEDGMGKRADVIDFWTKVAEVRTRKLLSLRAGD